VAGSIKISPHTFFRLSAVLGLLGVLLILPGNQILVVAGAILAGLGFGNIWPMLFSITVEDRPERANELSGLMCMAISGGALVPLVMGQLVDIGKGSLAFIVPAACFAYLLLLSLKGGKQPATAPTKG
jgi:fucose permease